MFIVSPVGQSKKIKEKFIYIKFVNLKFNEYLFLLKFLLDSNLPLLSCKLLDLFCGWSGSNCKLNSVKNHGKYKMNSKIPIEAIIILKKNCKKISSHQKPFSKRLYFNSCKCYRCRRYEVTHPTAVYRSKLKYLSWDSVTDTGEHPIGIKAAWIPGPRVSPKLWKPVLIDIWVVSSSG